MNIAMNSSVTNNILAQFRRQLSAAGQQGGTTLAVSDGPREFVCEIVQCDSLAVAFEQFSLRTSELATVSLSDLERLGKSLSERLTYLLEPISPIEADADQCTVQMRSNPPQRDDDGRSYYELLVRRGGELTLVRYRKEPGSPRQRIPATVTTEVLLRLAGDFCAVLD